MNEIARDFRWQSDLDLGEIYPFDEVLAGYDPSAHFVDDFFRNRLAFAVLLNFPLTTLEGAARAGAERGRGASGPRRAWPSASPSACRPRSTSRSPRPTPRPTATSPSTTSGCTTSSTRREMRLFPPKMRLLSHWNLRDEIKADYSDAKNGLAKQRMIAQVMDRIVTQTIPGRSSSTIRTSTGIRSPTRSRPSLERDSDRAAPPDLKITNAPEPDTRYAMLLKTFQAARHGRSVLADRADADRAALRREPPDPRGAGQGDARRGRSPRRSCRRSRRSSRAGSAGRSSRSTSGTTASGRAASTPRKSSTRSSARSTRRPRPSRRTSRTSSSKLGFSQDRAQYLADHIVVDPARGSGHALGAARRADKAHLRTRVEKDGMNYKGFNIAVHELGHNVEQTFSLNDVDSTLLAGRSEHRLHRGARVRLPGARPGAARPRASPTRRARR